MEERAIDLFFSIEKADNILLSIFFNTCAKLQTENALISGKKVFNQYIIESNLTNDVLYSVLNMFIKCNDLQSAEILFDKIERDIICYGSMMKFYNIKDQPEKTLELFERMKQENLKPNEVIFVLLLNAYSKIGDLELSQSLMCEIPEDLLSNPWIQTGLIDLWVKVLLISID
jgi:pentatricopeptide repeat protein